MALALGVTLFTMGMFVVGTIPYQKQLLVQSMESKAEVLATSVSQVTVASIITEDYTAVIEHCMKVVKERPTVLYLVLVKKDGFSLINTRTGWRQEQLSGFWLPTEQGPRGMLIKSPFGEEQVYHYRHPVVYSGIKWGWINVAFSLEAFSSGVRMIYFRTILLAGFCLVCGLIASLVFARRLSRPILLLEAFTRRVATGDLSSRVSIASGDEVENLAESFNRMISSLEVVTASRDDLNHEIAARKKVEAAREQTARRQVQLNALQRELLGPGTLDEKLKLITDNVVSMFDADFARIWIIQQGDRCQSGCVHAKATEGPHVCIYRDRCLHLKASSGRYTHIDGETHRRVPFGCYKIGLVAAGQDPKFLTNDVTRDPRVHNNEWAAELGLVSFAGYQLRPPGGETIGVLALFAKHAISPEEDILLEMLGHTTAQMVQRAKVEDALHQSERQYAEIVREYPDGIVSMDASGSLIAWNPAAERLFGYPAEAIVGKKFMTLAAFTPASLAVAKEEFARVVGGEERVFLLTFVRKDKTEFVAEVSARLGLSEGGAASVHVAFRDVTERVRAEEAVKLARQDAENRALELQKVNKQLSRVVAEKDDFLRAVSHDLSAPLRNIGGMAAFLKSQYVKCLDETGQNRLDRILSNVAVQNGLIQDLLELSHIKTRRGKLQQTDIHAMLREMADQFSFDLEKKSGRIDLNGEFPVVWCETNRIRQVFQNLFDNAIKYAHPNRPLQIAVIGQQDDGKCRFTVSDNGIGMRKEDTESIFFVFRRVHNAYTAKIEGKGVGLATVKTIVENHGGEIWVESQEGCGSSFIFTLPVSPVAEAKSASAE
jgi:PAS domain S-box-containing protein